ncbi:hypothetical protein AYK24_04530 [Thermoplasmatales archaeon SG8-52-4]|nr:MAG: hypothetical protein AYK24_04530 [Thermoplasmatales archaeon SG8-52-4]
MNNQLKASFMISLMLISIIFTVFNVNAIPIKKKSLVFPCIEVNVEEIYGTIDNPKYKPLPNVSVEIESSIFGIFWNFVWSGKTDEIGTTGDVVVSAAGLYYKITVSKDQYHTYKCNPELVIFIESGVFNFEEYFTMAEDGSPFQKYANQNICNLYDFGRLPLLNLLLQCLTI